jgi:endonuclease I
METMRNRYQVDLFSRPEELMNLFSKDHPVWERCREAITPKGAASCAKTTS